MDNTTTILDLKVANPNDTSVNSKKKLVIAYSTGETDFMTYDEVEDAMKDIDNANAQRQQATDIANIKKALYQTVIQRCNTELGITDEEPEEDQQ